MVARVVATQSYRKERGDLVPSHWLLKIYNETNGLFRSIDKICGSSVALYF
jgi:hypothetical protein